MDHFLRIKQAPLTIVLIVACVALYLPELAGMNLSSYMAVRAGGMASEPWTLITAMFAHGSIEHLAFNMISLWYLGSVLETLQGTPRFALVYFLSGIAGNVAFSMVGTGAAVGASGAIFGLLGALAILLLMIRGNPAARSMLNGLLSMLAINVVNSFLPGIAMEAHFGGLAVGVVVELALIGLAKRATAVGPGADEFVLLLNGRPADDASAAGAPSNTPPSQYGLPADQGGLPMNHQGGSPVDRDGLPIDDAYSNHQPDASYPVHEDHQPDAAYPVHEGHQPDVPYRTQPNQQASVAVPHASAANAAPGQGASKKRLSAVIAIAAAVVVTGVAFGAMAVANFVGGTSAMRVIGSETAITVDASQYDMWAGDEITGFVQIPSTWKAARESSKAAQYGYVNTTLSYSSSANASDSESGALEVKFSQESYEDAARKFGSNRTSSSASGASGQSSSGSAVSGDSAESGAAVSGGTASPSAEGGDAPDASGQDGELTIAGHRASKAIKKENGKTSIVYFIDRSDAVKSGTGCVTVKFTFENEPPAWLDATMNNYKMPNMSGESIEASVLEGCPELGQHDKQWVGDEAYGYFVVPNTWHRASSISLGGEMDMMYYDAALASDKNAKVVGSLSFGSFEITWRDFEMNMKNELKSQGDYSIESVNVNGSLGHIVSVKSTQNGTDSVESLLFLEGGNPKATLNMIDAGYPGTDYNQCEALLATYTKTK